MQALELGAVDCYAKPTGAGGNIIDADGGRLAELIRTAAQVRPHASWSQDAAPQGVAAVASARATGSDAIIAVGASTGGVEALGNMLRRFPVDCPPTIIVQHINAQFAPAMAARLDSQCPPKIALAEPDLPFKRGHVYIAPGNDRHLTVRISDGKPYARLRPGDPVSGHRPSIDALFHSVAQAMPGRAVGVLLTGMGQDGAQGLLAMRQTGCPTIAQDQASCVVYGMPRAAVELGAAEFVVSLPQIADKALGLLAA